MYCMLYAKNMIYCILKQVWIKLDVKLERNRSTIICLTPLRQWGHEQTKVEWNEPNVAWALHQEQQKMHCLFVCAWQHFYTFHETNAWASAYLNLPPWIMLINKATETKNWLPLFSSNVWQNASSQDGQHEIREAISIQLRITRVSSAEVVSGASYFYKRARLIIWPSGLLVRLWAELQGDDVVDKPGCSTQVQIYCFILVQCHSRVQGIDRSKAGQTLAEALGGVALVVESRLPLPLDSNTHTIQYTSI